MQTTFRVQNTETTRMQKVVQRVQMDGQGEQVERRMAKYRPFPMNKFLYTYPCRPDACNDFWLFWRTNWIWVGSWLDLHGRAQTVIEPRVKK